MKIAHAVIACCLPAVASHALAATVEVDKDRSRIQVDAKATGHAFTGTLKDFTASGSGDLSMLKPADFKLSWSFADLDTDDTKRDAEMVKWLGGGAPKGGFQFVKTWAGKDGSTMAMGNLTIHGVTKTISFPYTAKKEGDWVTIDGRVSLDYQDFKLPIIRSMAVMTVDPKLVVRFHVVGKAR